MVPGEYCAICQYRPSLFELSAGETGAASLGGALGVLELGGRDLVGLTPDSTVLLIVTEGATDPVRYEQIVGHPPTR